MSPISYKIYKNLRNSMVLALNFRNVLSGYWCTKFCEPIKNLWLLFNITSFVEHAFHALWQQLWLMFELLKHLLITSDLFWRCFLLIFAHYSQISWNFFLITSWCLLETNYPNSSSINHRSSAENQAIFPSLPGSIPWLSLQNYLLLLVDLLNSPVTLSPVRTQSLFSSPETWKERKKIAEKWWSVISHRSHSNTKDSCAKWELKKHS